MGVAIVTILSQLILVGLASAQIIKLPLIRRVQDLDSEFAAALPAPQKYSLTRWTEDEISRGLPKDPAWAGSLYDKNSRFYCKDDFAVYNVTFTDCPEPWLVGYCAKAEMDKEAAIDMLARFPPTARGAISDLLITALKPGLINRHVRGNSALFSGRFRPADAVQVLATALFKGTPGVPMDDFMKAVAADTCVADEDAANNLKRDGSHGRAVESGLMIAAYLKIAKRSLDASCMGNQLKLLGSILNKQWDAPGQCPNKVAPKLVKYKSILFTHGLGELEESDPISGAEPIEVIPWKKSEGFPEYCWAMAQRKRSGDRGVWCPANRLDVYNVTYADCLDQDPWAICHCNDAQQSVNTVVTKFGRVPAGLRSRVRHLIVFENGSPGGVRLGPWNIIGIYGDVRDSVYMHEASHCTDRDFHKSEAFQRAKALDTCWPSDYSKSSDAELFAETGVAYLYDNSGKTLRERGYDPSCLSNGLKALGAHAGSEYKKGSRCFKRQPNSRIVHPTEGGVMSAELFNSEIVIETFS